MGGPWLAYGSGFYMVSLSERYNVRQGGNWRGHPDVYSARLGAAYLLPAYDGLAFTLGGMVNGVFVTKDLIGGGDRYWRRPGYQVYAEPGITWSRGLDIVSSCSYPLRVYQDKKDSLLDESLNRRIGSRLRRQPHQGQLRPALLAQPRRFIQSRAIRGRASLTVWDDASGGYPPRPLARTLVSRHPGRRQSWCRDITSPMPAAAEECSDIIGTDWPAQLQSPDHSGSRFLNRTTSASVPDTAA